MTQLFADTRSVRRRALLQTRQISPKKSFIAFFLFLTVLTLAFFVLITHKGITEILYHSQ